MKEIKYQVYHKPSKTIQVVAVIDFNNRVLDTFGIDEPIYDIPFDDVEWRIYTGLKDKNRNDIYMGDIVESQYFSRSEVIFKDGCFMAFDIPLIYETDSIYPDNEWVIVGHKKYEN
jgi:hypothetical protein